MQQAELKTQDAALNRQGRQEFLTARLNAAVAMLRAHEARRAVRDDIKPQIPGFTCWVSDWHAKRDIEKLLQDIAILRHEVHLGVEDEPWSPRIERQAIRAYLAGVLNELRDSHFAHVAISVQSSDAHSNLFRVHGQLLLLSQQLRSRHADVADLALKMFKDAPVRPIPDEKPSERVDLIMKWIDDHLRNDLGPMSSIWQKESSPSPAPSSKARSL